MLAIGAKGKALIAAGETAMALRETGDMAAVATFVKGDYVAVVNTYFSSIDEFVGLQERVAEAVEANSRAQKAATTMTGLIGAGLVFAIGIAVAVWLVRSIRTPLQQSVQMARAIAQGDLTQIINTTRQDEFGELIRALQDMNEGLVRIVGNVLQSA